MELMYVVKRESTHVKMIIPSSQTEVSAVREKKTVAND